ncbi:hypothetical protein C8Q75DRAFT_712549 [Abortiporus biennis]|nr:hypothetical protein C8Q75DRAFT_712549 [Abortiporus biennis]
MSESIQLDIQAIASIYPHHDNEAELNVVVGQIQHRADLIKLWDIKPGEHILEIGCGQGDCTVTLATAIGERGHVTAVDPAPLDYGSPYTLGEAHDHLLSSSIGPRMSFVEANPITFLNSTSNRYTTAVIAHCIWYFSSPQALQDILKILSTRADRICIAEWALTTQDFRAFPHVLSALTQSALECRKTESQSNIRTVLSPKAIRQSALTAGLTIQKEDIVTPNEGMLDGSWETSSVLSSQFEEELSQYVKDERERSVIVAMRDSVCASRDSVKAQNEKVKSMDVWVSTFIASST